ncbi:hypothetical protein C7S16_2482 [Burkholderia thailandensis]|uniref:Uncharacterized protein n=2 Tax=Burkholderia thailandensis TaxID=57975 RepID=A0AAW9D2F4_BURTH|nr:hypothetical protein [Burkholderia thailandensis]MDW9255439.1 hypothetical protein [Burkholderia thailandensis]
MAIADTATRNRSLPDGEHGRALPHRLDEWESQCADGRIDALGRVAGR